MDALDAGDSWIRLTNHSRGAKDVPAFENGYENDGVVPAPLAPGKKVAREKGGGASLEAVYGNLAHFTCFLANVCGLGPLDNAVEEYVADLMASTAAAMYRVASKREEDDTPPWQNVSTEEDRITACLSIRTDTPLLVTLLSYALMGQASNYLEVRDPAVAPGAAHDAFKAVVRSAWGDTGALDRATKLWTASDGNPLLKVNPLTGPQPGTGDLDTPSLRVLVASRVQAVVDMHDGPPFVMLLANHAVLAAFVISPTEKARMYMVDTGRASTAVFDYGNGAEDGDTRSVLVNSFRQFRANTPLDTRPGPPDSATASQMIGWVDMVTEWIVSDHAARLSSLEKETRPYRGSGAYPYGMTHAFEVFADFPAFMAEAARKDLVSTTVEPLRLGSTPSVADGGYLDQVARGFRTLQRPRAMTLDHWKAGNGKPGAISSLNPFPAAVFQVVLQAQHGYWGDTSTSLPGKARQTDDTRKRGGAICHLADFLSAARFQSKTSTPSQRVDPGWSTTFFGQYADSWIKDGDEAVATAWALQGQGRPVNLLNLTATAPHMPPELAYVFDPWRPAVTRFFRFGAQMMWAASRRALDASFRGLDDYPYGHFPTALAMHVFNALTGRFRGWTTGMAAIESSVLEADPALRDLLRDAIMHVSTAVSATAADRAAGVRVVCSTPSIRIQTPEGEPFAEGRLRRVLFRMGITPETTRATFMGADRAATEAVMFEFRRLVRVLTLVFGHNYLARRSAAVVEGRAPAPRHPRAALQDAFEATARVLGLRLVFAPVTPSGGGRLANKSSVGAAFLLNIALTQNPRRFRGRGSAKSAAHTPTSTPVAGDPTYHYTDGRHFPEDDDDDGDGEDDYANLFDFKDNGAPVGYPDGAAALLTKRLMMGTRQEVLRNWVLSDLGGGPDVARVVFSQDDPLASATEARTKTLLSVLRDVNNLIDRLNWTTGGVDVANQPPGAWDERVRLRSLYEYARGLLPNEFWMGYNEEDKDFVRALEDKVRIPEHGGDLGKWARNASKIQIRSIRVGYSLNDTERSGGGLFGAYSSTEKGAREFVAGTLGSRAAHASSRPVTTYAPEDVVWNRAVRMTDVVWSGGKDPSDDRTAFFHQTFVAEARAFGGGGAHVTRLFALGDEHVAVLEVDGSHIQFFVPGFNIKFDFALTTPSGDAAVSTATRLSPARGSSVIGRLTELLATLGLHTLAIDPWDFQVAGLMTSGTQDLNVEGFRSRLRNLAVAVARCVPGTRVEWARWAPFGEDEESDGVDLQDIKEALLKEGRGYDADDVDDLDDLEEQIEEIKNASLESVLKDVLNDDGPLGQAPARVVALARQGHTNVLSQLFLHQDVDALPSYDKGDLVAFWTLFRAETMEVTEDPMAAAELFEEHGPDSPLILREYFESVREKETAALGTTQLRADVLKVVLGILEARYDMEWATWTAQDAICRVTGGTSPRQFHGAFEGEVATAPEDVVAKFVRGALDGAAMPPEVLAVLAGARGFGLREKGEETVAFATTLDSVRKTVRGSRSLMSSHALENGLTDHLVGDFLARADESLVALRANLRRQLTEGPKFEAIRLRDPTFVDRVVSTVTLGPRDTGVSNTAWVSSPENKARIGRRGGVLQSLEQTQFNPELVVRSMPVPKPGDADYVDVCVFGGCPPEEARSPDDPLVNSDFVTHTYGDSNGVVSIHVFVPSFEKGVAHGPTWNRSVHEKVVNATVSQTARRCCGLMGSATSDPGLHRNLVVLVAALVLGVRDAERVAASRLRDETSRATRVEVAVLAQPRCSPTTFTVGTAQTRAFVHPPHARRWTQTTETKLENGAPVSLHVCVSYDAVTHVAAMGVIHQTWSAANMLSRQSLPFSAVVRTPATEAAPALTRFETVFMTPSNAVPASKDFVAEARRHRRAFRSRVLLRVSPTWGPFPDANWSDSDSEGEEETKGGGGGGGDDDDDDELVLAMNFAFRRIKKPEREGFVFGFDDIPRTWTGKETSRWIPGRGVCLVRDPHVGAVVLHRDLYTPGHTGAAALLRMYWHSRVWTGTGPLPLDASLAPAGRKVFEGTTLTWPSEVTGLWERDVRGDTAMLTLLVKLISEVFHSLMFVPGMAAFYQSVSVDAEWNPMRPVSGNGISPHLLIEPTEVFAPRAFIRMCGHMGAVSAMEILVNFVRSVAQYLEAPFRTHVAHTLFVLVSMVLFRASNSTDAMDATAFTLSDEDLLDPELAPRRDAMMKSIQRLLAQAAPVPVLAFDIGSHDMIVHNTSVRVGAPTPDSPPSAMFVTTLSVTDGDQSVSVTRDVGARYDWTSGGVDPSRVDVVWEAKDPSGQWMPLASGFVLLAKDVLETMSKNEGICTNVATSGLVLMAFRARVSYRNNTGDVTTVASPLYTFHHTTPAL